MKLLSAVSSGNTIDVTLHSSEIPKNSSILFRKTPFSTAVVVINMSSKSKNKDITPTAKIGLILISSIHSLFERLLGSVYREFTN